MDVSPGLAAKIVSSMKQTINQDINFIDRDGIIIASTDSRRIGTFHEAGKKVVDTGEMVVIDDHSQYEGSRPGINMPVRHNDEVIAAIGITGSSQQVVNYGNIIRRMTEILILEAEFQSLKQRERERETMLLEDLIFYPQYFSERWNKSIQLEWQGEPEKRVLVIKPCKTPFPYLKEAQIKIEQFFSTVLSDYKQSLLYMERDQALVILYRESISQEIRKCLNILLALAEKMHNSVFIALGSPTAEDFKQSYQDALLALDTVITDSAAPESRIVDYSELTIELLLDSHNRDRQLVFKNRILSSLTPKEYNEFQEIVEAFETYNGSITHIAEELFIHKNTLQYKIQKLKKLTGYDLRRYHDFMVLRIAFTIR